MDSWLSIPISRDSIWKREVILRENGFAMELGGVKDRGVEEY